MTRLGLTSLALGTVAMFAWPSGAAAHEPIFGLGPHTIYRGGWGLELEYEFGRSTGLNGAVERIQLLHPEVLYGLTENLSVTLSLPFALERMERAGGGPEVSSTGLADMVLRAKYRLWRLDQPGTQTAAALIGGIKFPTGNEELEPALGTGSTDFLLALTAAREGRRWYYFADAQARLKTEANDLRQGHELRYDLAWGVRPWKTDYLEPDLVLLIEANGTLQGQAVLRGQEVEDSGGHTLALSPGFLLSLRNVMLKGGVRLPVLQDLNGVQMEEEVEAVGAIEVHL